MPSSKEDLMRVSALHRAAFYASCSYCIEVLWTALYDRVILGAADMRGYSSLWSLAIYGMSFAVFEKLFFVLQERRWHWTMRGLLYMVISFAVELSFGLVLQYFDANSWDYSKQFAYHYKGLIALEYAPLWFVGSLTFEIQLKECNRIAWRTS